MPTHRQKYNYYAVTNGKEIGIYSSWTQAGDSVLGFAKAKFKGFCTYSEAAACMSSSGYSDFNVFDGENTYSRSAYEQSRGHRSCTLDTNTMEHESTEKDASENEGVDVQIDQNIEHQDTIPTVYIDGSCIRNGASTAQAGYGLFWGDQHPWNCSHLLPQDSAATNNKAELAAAIKALQVARDHNLERLIVYSDSNYVIQGVTEWIYKWNENGWKTAGGEDVKNKDIWMELANLAQDSKIKITWKHVAAHSGIPGNEEADKLAVKAAKHNTINTQRSEECSGDLSRINICSILEKPTASNTQPKVIVIQKKITPIPINTTVQPVIKINTTPNRKATRDRSETPVPGSMNGSFVSTHLKSAGPQRVKTQGKAECSDSIKESADNIQTSKIMTNMETILESIVAELHQLREDQLEFKKEIKQQISGIQEKQQEVGKCVSSLSKEVTENIRSCVVKVEKLGENSKREQTVNHSHDELKTAVSNFQKKVDSRFDLTRTSIQTLETSITSARSSMDKLSRDCTTEFHSLESKNTQIEEALSEISTNIRKTGHTLTEVEKSLTSISEKDEFTRPSRTVKERTCDVESTPVTDNKFAELENESDDEVIFKGAEPGKRKSFKSASTQVSDISNGEGTPEKSANTTNNIKEKLINTEGNSDSDKRKTYTRTDMVYLVGDSISGQVNPAILGKATKTFVKKLKASKIEDLHALTDQVKDAKMIIIHTGINNLRGKDSTADRGKGLIESIASFREAAPDSKIVVSKVIPIGDHEVDIDRNLFNAENEKRLTEINKSEISFIDHGNLAERGVPIKDYYRPDLIHLAGQGIAVFTGNLEKEIIKGLRKEEQRAEIGSETSHSTQHNGSRNTNGLDQYNDRGDRNYRPYKPADKRNGQYNRQHNYPEGRDQRHNTDNGYPRNHDLSGYPSRNDNGDNERQYHRNYNRGNERNYYRNDNRDNDRHYYRSDYNKDNRGYDKQRTFNSGNYLSERLDERDNRYSRVRYFDNDDYYYYGRRRNGHSQ